MTEDSKSRVSRCDCYECVGPEYEYTDDGSRLLKNNLKKHTQFEACETCGRPKTEYRDLVTKGYYECWWCRERGAGPGGPDVINTGAPIEIVYLDWEEL